MRIRPGNVGDAQAISVVHVRSWQAAYRGMLPQEYLDGLRPERRLPVWRSRLAAARPGGVLVAEIDDRVAGFAAFGPARDADEDAATVAEITTIYVAPETWGRGAGKALLAAAVETLAAAGHRTATLWVLDANARARRFYEAAGWRLDDAIGHDTRCGVEMTTVRYRLILARDRS